MAYEVEYTDEFLAWWDTLGEGEQGSVEESVDLLKLFGPELGRPYADTLKRSRFSNMKELRPTHGSRPIRVFFAFNPQRNAILLIGGDKSGNKRFYDEMIPRADAIYAQHLSELKDEQEVTDGPQFS